MQAITALFRRTLLLTTLAAAFAACGVDDQTAARTDDDETLNPAIGDRGPEETDPDLEASPTVTGHTREEPTLAPFAHEPHRE